MAFVTLIDFESNLAQLKNFQQNEILMSAQWRSFAPAEPLAWDTRGIGMSCRGTQPS